MASFTLERLSDHGLCSGGVHGHPRFTQLSGEVSSLVAERCRAFHGLPWLFGLPDFSPHFLHRGLVSWQAVALHILESEMPDLGECIEFDPEADMFCAYGSDRAALERLGERLADVARHPKRLAKVIASIPPSAWDD